MEAEIYQGVDEMGSSSFEMFYSMEDIYNIFFSHLFK